MPPIAPTLPGATGGRPEGRDMQRAGGAPIPPIAAAGFRARAQRAVARGRIELGLACGVVFAGLAAVLAALLGTRTGSLAELLIRVHGAGLLGLAGMVWGGTLAEQAALRLSTGRAVHRALASASSAGEVAALLAGIDG